MTCFRGSGLDERGVSGAEIEIRKQAHCTFDFIKCYVGGCENSSPSEWRQNSAFARRGVLWAMLGIPLRCLVRRGIEGLQVAGGCISVDEIAFGSTRNVPAYAMTGEAAAVPPRAAAGIMPSAVKVTEIQNRLRAFGITLGSFDG